jgi:hypothetical protein
LHHLKMMLRHHVQFFTKFLDNKKRLMEVNLFNDSSKLILLVVNKLSK